MQIWLSSFLRGCVRMSFVRPKIGIVLRDSGRGNDRDLEDPASCRNPAPLVRWHGRLRAATEPFFCIVHDAAPAPRPHTTLSRASSMSVIFHLLLVATCASRAARQQGLASSAPDSPGGAARDDAKYYNVVRQGESCGQCTRRISLAAVVMWGKSEIRPGGRNDRAAAAR